MGNVNRERVYSTRCKFPHSLSVITDKGFVIVSPEVKLLSFKPVISGPIRNGRNASGWFAVKGWNIHDNSHRFSTPDEFIEYVWYHGSCDPFSFE